MQSRSLSNSSGREMLILLTGRHRVRATAGIVSSHND
jgi:hypothetical protein